MVKLQLREENLYAKGYVIELEGGRLLLKRNILQYTPSAANDRTHELREGENLWDVAFRSYTNSKWWHAIADVNNIYNPFEIPEGTDLIIPDIDVIRSS